MGVKGYFWKKEFGGGGAGEPYGVLEMIPNALLGCVLNEYS